MMMHTTLAQLRSLKLDGLAAGLEEQLAQPGIAALSFEERVALLIDREVHARNDRKLVRLLKNAHFKYGQAAIEDIDTFRSRHRPPRGDEPSLGRVGQRRPQRVDHRPDRRWQVLSGLRAGAVRLPSWLLCDLPACAPLAGRTAHPARQRGLRQMAAATGQDRRPGA